ncbi:hypothetical protein MKO06_11720 [Gramella sp. GC03-9]|uniref:DUF4878 domain-containing protein n=1 Tax=Christiangramia oceanisediminis TaxID=2920386 RepID=A0A9X2KYR9_9FLAO|nr:hypothetical protein [Gramella oceanisediminis]MCP9200581.1 hypothetical protein [Gramella oceanisediminis]
MKKLLFFSMICAISCGDSPKSPEETARLVVESFYNRDNAELKKYTTPGIYQSYISVQDQFTNVKAEESNFSVVRDTVYGDTAWVKFNSAYADRPETFKLIRKEGMWKVTETGLRERSPF